MFEKSNLQKIPELILDIFVLFLLYLFMSQNMSANMNNNASRNMITNIY